jgi:membrane-anchored protein YejM (alkaline phosphatase superfamily)
MLEHVAKVLDDHASDVAIGVLLVDEHLVDQVLRRELQRSLFSLALIALLCLLLVEWSQLHRTARHTRDWSRKHERS